MDYSMPTSLDESDEPIPPPRSPSRLDFCIEDYPPRISDEYDPNACWGSEIFSEDCLYPLVEEDIFAVNTAPLDRLSTVENDKNDLPQVADAHESYNSIDASETLSEQTMDEVVCEPQAPVPVRPPSVQARVDALEGVSPPRPANQRPSCGHHGLSRSALLQQKTLWNSRHEEWVEWQSRLDHGEAEIQESEKDHACIGIAIVPRVSDSPPSYVLCTPPSGLERDLPHRKYQLDVRSSIYPRTGDISALRDPHPADMDRCFFNFPLWTLHKMLYVFDMQQTPASLDISEKDASPIQASVSSTLSTYSSCTSEGKPDPTFFAESSPKSQQPPERMSPLPPWNRVCGWNLSWYARWELLINLLQYDRPKCDLLDASATLSVPYQHPTPLSHPGRVFRFTTKDDQDDRGKEEDDEYVPLVSDSSFCADFEEECDRAFALYKKGAESLEMIF